MFGDTIFTGNGGYTEFVLAEKYRLRIIACSRHGSILGYRIEYYTKEGEAEKYVHTIDEAIMAYHEYFYIKGSTTQKLVLP